MISDFEVKVCCKAVLFYAHRNDLLLVQKLKRALEGGFQAAAPELGYL
jgi:hypothetical protein